jgi:hypothetical protein
MASEHDLIAEAEMICAANCNEQSSGKTGIDGLKRGENFPALPIGHFPAVVAKQDHSGLIESC